MRWQTVAGWSLAAILFSAAVVAVDLARIAVREDLRSSPESSAERPGGGGVVVFSGT